MKSKEYYTTFKETSKTFRLMGDAVGITATRRTQRGIIAKKYLEATMLILALVLMYFMRTILTSYNTRMKEYNRHMCVDVYGLNEQCQKGGE